MTAQLTMFGGPLPTPEIERQERRARRVAARPSIDQRFAAFWKANPRVWDELKRLAFARLARGERRIGVKALWEELRASLFEIEAGGDGPDNTQTSPYKLNNDFTALYARKLIQNHPELAAVIEVRKRKGEK